MHELVLRNAFECLCLTYFNARENFKAQSINIKHKYSFSTLELWFICLKWWNLIQLTVFMIISTCISGWSTRKTFYHTLRVSWCFHLIRNLSYIHIWVKINFNIPYFQKFISFSISRTLLENNNLIKTSKWREIVNILNSQTKP